MRKLIYYPIVSALIYAGCCAPAAGLFAQTPTAVPVLTWRYDLTHAGQNTSETELTPANVASNSFGKLFSLAVDDRVFAQPLYVPNLKMSDGQAHNVLFVATENDSVYAFDADTKGNPIWKISLLTAAHGAGAGATPVPQTDTSSEDIGPNIGITGTPTIDPATNTMFVVANTKESGAYFSRLHAINIVTGAEQPNSPVTITAKVAGNGAGSSGGQISFSALQQNQRPALNFYNGYVYIAYASHGDVIPWQGWVFAYNASTLQQSAAICLDPEDQGASVWGSGAGMPIDTNVSGGRMFVVTGNGGRSSPFNANSDYGESVITFNLANGKLTPTDAWTSYNYQNLNTQDWDQGSGGLLMLPDQPGANPHLIITAGKEGRITLLNRDKLGGLASNNSTAVQDFTISSIPQGEGFWGTAAYWNGNVYMWAGGDNGGTPNVGMAFKLNNGLLSTTPSSETTFTSAFPGPTFSVSSNGNQNGIVWAVKFDQFNSSGPAVLYAFDPDDLATILYESDTKSSDTAGPANKFSVPVVTNGKVYVAAKGQVDVYGLLNAQQTAAAPVITPNGGTFSSTQSVTMSSATGSAAIYYTLDGSNPTTASTQYSGPITVSTDTTINAIASAAGYAQSSVSTATFNFSNQTPPVTFSPAAGTYMNAQTVTISESDANAKIYYTTDGTTPSAASNLYSGPLQVGTTETIKAIAIDPALNNSNIGTAAYVIQNGGTSINFGNGFSNAQGLALNGSATLAYPPYLDLTTGGTSQAGSAYWNAPINVQAFTTSFEFQIGNAQANGFTFTIQNTGTTALGGSSAGLGYQDIQKSVAVKFNFYNYNNEGGDSTGLYTNGQAPVTPTVDISPSGIQLKSGDAIQAQITYDGTTLTLSLTDTVTNATFTTSWPINIPQVVGGNAAYVGFTAGTGGLSSTVSILSWIYNTQAVPPAFAPAAGTYGSAQNVTLSSATADAAIYYTTDGTTPTSTSNAYSAPFAVPSSETIKAIAISKTMGTSNVATAAYVIQPGAANATFSLTGTPVSISAPGASATSNVTVTPSSGFTGSVSLTCAITGGSGASAPSCTVTQPPAISGAQAVTGSVAVATQSTTAAGNYTMTVTGTSGTQTASTTVAITVAPPMGSPQFALGGTPVSIGSPGTNAKSTITITPSGGFTGSVSLSCAVTGGSGAATAPTCTVTQPAAISGAQAVTTTVAVNTQSTTVPGNYMMSVTGTSGTLTSSAKVAITVSPGPPSQTSQFALSATPVTIASPGSNSTSTVTITPSGGFTGAVALTCAITSSPANASNPPSCLISQPPSITGSQPVTATLTVVTSPTASAALPHPMIALGGGGTLAALFLLFVPRRRRRWQSLLGLLLLGALIAGASGCAVTAGKIANQTPGGTTAGDYVITVTGTSGSMQQTTAVPVTIN